MSGNLLEDQVCQVDALLLLLFSTSSRLAVPSMLQQVILLFLSRHEFPVRLEIVGVDLNLLHLFIILAPCLVLVVESVLLLRAVVTESRVVAKVVDCDRRWSRSFSSVLLSQLPTYPENVF